MLIMDFYFTFGDQLRLSSVGISVLGGSFVGIKEWVVC